MKQLTTINRDETVCFTGHRTIPDSELPELGKITDHAVAEAWSAGYRVFICGGARGFDTMAAQAVLRFRIAHPEIRLVIAVPCLSQSDKWPAADRDIYHHVLEQADFVEVLSGTYYTGCMQYRNRFMVDHSSLCLCYLTRFEGGTWSTVRYALHQGVALKNLAIHEVLKENSWSFIYTSRFASGNVSIVHLSPFRPTHYKKTYTSTHFLKKPE